MKNKIVLSTLIGLMSLGTISCSNETNTSDYVPNYNEPTYTPYEGEDDSKFSPIITGIMNTLVGKVVESAKDAALKASQNSITTITSKAEMWIQNNIFDCLGIHIFEPEENYTINDVYDSLEQLKETLDDLKQTVDAIAKAENDQKYTLQFDLFNNYYLDALTYEVPFNNLAKADSLSSSSAVDKQNIYDSVEKSIRKGENITQKTDLYDTTLKFGLSILGNEQPSSNLSKYSIFSLVRHLVESEVPFDVKQKYYEDNYLSSVIATYQSIYALNQFDLTYNMAKNGIENIIVANSNGQVIGFTYQNENYYYWLEEEFNNPTLKIQETYKNELSSMKDYKFPSSSIITNFTDIRFLFDYYSQQEAVKTAIMVSYNNFTRNVDSQYYNLTTNSLNRKLAKKVNSMHFADFLLNDYYVKNSVVYYIIKVDFDRFDFIEKSTWNAFVNAIKPYAGDKTFYEYLSFIGFEIPRDDKAPKGYQCILPLAVTKDDKYEHYDQNRKMEWTQGYVIYINFDMKIKDYTENSLDRIVIYHYKYRSGSCNEKWHYDGKNYRLAKRQGDRYVDTIPNTKVNYLDLNLLSWSGLVGDHKVKTGKISTENLSTNY